MGWTGVKLAQRVVCDNPTYRLLKGVVRVLVFQS